MESDELEKRGMTTHLLDWRVMLGAADDLTPEVFGFRHAAIEHCVEMFRKKLLHELKHGRCVVGYGPRVGE